MKEAANGMQEMLLYYSFLQLHGVSARKEISLWRARETLDTLAARENVQLSFFDFETEGNDPNGLPGSAYRSIQALREKDASFFLERLESKEYYRVAYSFPQDVMFLDIETTGLSRVYHYITCIGWIVDGRYDCWIRGTDLEPFLKAFQKAKLIVTFNGTMFDCKFLDHYFGTEDFSQKPHLDLRYFCKRFGLSGGQKKIEQLTGFVRPDSLKETDGKEAIALWYSFLFGERKALKKLIEYNYYDLRGMTHLLDGVFFQSIYGPIFPKRGKPRRFEQNIKRDLPKCLPSAEMCKHIREEIKHGISNFSRERLKKAYPYRIIGIDLAGKVSSRTGLCFLRGSRAETRVAHTDEDIEQFICEKKPDLISIDAPLSLPNGRTSVYDDDPERHFGIMRESERELKRRGVNSYPALIRSMQELTKRGIELAERFRNAGYPVIECFPGAAQDVIQLPRKRTDESLLKRGLSRFGIQGPFRTEKVCHDELDAITASLVGQFFISGYYEPLGCPEENDMIIPQREYRLPAYKMVIGLAGPVAAGKTTVGEYIRQHGFQYIRYSQVIGSSDASGDGLPGRNELRDAGAALYQGKGQYGLNEKLAGHISGDDRVVIDGMRHNEDYTFWKEHCFTRFVLVYIDTDYELCKSRFLQRGNEECTYEEAVNHPAEADVAGLRSKADIVIQNNSELKELFLSVDRILVELNKSMDSEGQ